MNRTSLLRLFLLALCWSVICHAEVYRWTDADGRIQFSDRAPSGEDNGAQDISSRYQSRIPFRFEITPVDYAMPHDTRNKVEVAVSKIHEILRSRLGLNFHSDPSFDIRIFKDRNAFSRYGDGVPLAGRASGYFSRIRNEAVTWRQQSFEQMLEVITHEANHALMHHKFRGVPAWLNEGLSEYFERMEVFGLAVVIHPQPEWDAVIKRQVRDGSITPLKDYMALSHRDWQVHNLQDNRSYAQAWSLVYFLMSTSEGTRLLGHLLGTLDRVGAGDFSAVDLIEANHKGGLSALETAWRSWVFSQKRPHHY